MKIIHKAEEYFIAVLAILASILLFINVFMRYVFSAGIVWSEEAIRYMIIWIAFIGSAVCFRKGMHFGVDVILRVKNPVINKVIRLFIQMVSLTFCILMVIYGYRFTSIAHEMHQVSAAAKIPMEIVYGVIPVSSFFSAIYCIQNIIGIVVPGKAAAAEEEEQKAEEDV